MSYRYENKTKTTKCYDYMKLGDEKVAVVWSVSNQTNDNWFDRSEQSTHCLILSVTNNTRLSQPFNDGWDDVLRASLSHEQECKTCDCIKNVPADVVDDVNKILNKHQQKMIKHAAATDEDKHNTSADAVRYVQVDSTRMYSAYIDTNICMMALGFAFLALCLVVKD